MLPKPRSAALLALLHLLACRSRGERAPSPSASSAASPSPSVSASAAPPARVSPTFAELQKRASGAPPWPSGPGVACGDVRCKAGEFCCEGVEPRCLPKSRVKACLDAPSATTATAMECDESSDCGAGQICCYGIIFEKGARHVACKTPKECRIPLSRSGSLPFPGRELCARGGSCRDPRLVCIEDDGMPSGGRCVSKDVSVPCANGAVCTGDRPWCLWDPGTRTGECIPRGPWEFEQGVNSCDGPEDCVGEPCSAAGSRASCSMDATECFRFASEVCHTDADCPRPEVGPPRRFWRCGAGDENGLPGVKQCLELDEAPP